GRMTAGATLMTGRVTGAIALVVLCWSFVPMAEAASPGPAVDVAAAMSPLTQEDRVRLETLFAQWRAWRTDIVTAHLAYRSFHNSVEGGRTLAEFDDLLQGGKLGGGPEDLQRFVESMNGGPYRVNPPWGEGVLIVKDSRTRNNLGPFVAIDDRDVALYHDSLNNQYDTYAAGGSSHRADSLETFRPLPPEPWSIDCWRVLENGPGAVRLARLVPRSDGKPPEVDARTWDVDPETGLVAGIVRHTPEGKIQSVLRTLEHTALPDGITFPRIAAEAILADDVVTVMHVCVIDTLRINEPVPENAFHLAAAENSKIVDHRGARRSVTRLKQGEADIVDWLKKHAPAPASVTRRPSAVDHSVRNILLASNGLVLIVVGLVFWKRQSRSPV
ncbi:MAG TPA: hypothetical protein VM452_14590, partial [Caulifigura sp.]|nr:hypothetical protein [Caulifigura sp.]